MTLEALGAVLGISSQRVEQIEKRALAKLRMRPPRELQELVAMAAELQRSQFGVGVVTSPSPDWGCDVAIIDPEGLFGGERLASCSDERRSEVA